MKRKKSRGGDQGKDSHLFCKRTKFDLFFSRIMYMNIESCEVSSCADDTAVYYSCLKAQELENNINGDLE